MRNLLWVLSSSDVVLYFFYVTSSLERLSELQTQVPNIHWVMSCWSKLFIFHWHMWAVTCNACIHPEFTVCFFPLQFIYLFSYNSVAVPLTGFETGTVPTDSISQHNKAVILKYWQFFFENCPAVLAKKINCCVFSRLMLIPWITVPELVNVAVRTLALKSMSHMILFTPIAHDSLTLYFIWHIVLFIFSFVQQWVCLNILHYFVCSFMWLCGFGFFT